MTSLNQQHNHGMNSKYKVPLDHFPPLPFADDKMLPTKIMNERDKRETIMSPPMIMRKTRLRSSFRRSHKGDDRSMLPGTPSTVATNSTLDLVSSVQETENKIMEVTITVLSLDGLIAKRGELKERSGMLRELSSHGLSISRHGLSRLSNHGSSIKEMLSRHSSHSSKEESNLMRERLSRDSSHSSEEKVNKMEDGSMSLSNENKRKNDASSPESSDSTDEKPDVVTLVTSFSHSITQKNVLFTHLPSHPMELTSSTTVQPIAYWSSKCDLDDADQALSTLKFKRAFVQDTGTTFLPQKCPIRLSVSRNGKLINIGCAEIIIQGTEDGERTMSCHVKATRKANKSKLPLGKVPFPMSRANGDYMSFGLRPDAKLRVLVHVGIPNANVSSARSLNSKQHDFPIKEIMESTVYVSPIRNIIETVEKKTDSNCTGDDSPSDGNSTEDEIWEEYIVEDNELRQLREQLVKSENINKILQQEIAESRDALVIENDKYEQFCNELEHVKKISDSTIESLREELHVAKCEACMLPVYESRIAELLEELKNKDDALKQREVELQEKDDEIEFLREGMNEIKVGFKSQIDSLSHVDSLLWDKISPPDDKSVHKSTTPQNELKTDKWLAANMRGEWSELKNVIMRTSRRQSPNDKDETVIASNLVKWNNDEEKSEEDRADSEEDVVNIEEQPVTAGESLLSGGNENEASDEEA